MLKVIQEMLEIDYLAIGLLVAQFNTLAASTLAAD